VNGGVLVVLAGLVISIPELITIGKVVLEEPPRGRHHRRDSVWSLVALVVVLHAGLGVAAAVAGSGVS